MSSNNTVSAHKHSGGTGMWCQKCFQPVNYQHKPECAYYIEDFRAQRQVPYELIKRVRGMSEAEAIELVKSKGYEVRVSVRDNVAIGELPGPDNVRRLNIQLKKGKVILAHIG